MYSKLKVLKFLSKHGEAVDFNAVCDALGVRGELARGSLWSEVIYMENNGFLVITGTRSILITFEGLDYLRKEKASTVSFAVTITSAIFALIAAVAAVIALL